LPPESWQAAVRRINAAGEARYSDSDDDYDWEEVSGKKDTAFVKGNDNFGPGCRDFVDFSKASRPFGRMAGKAWNSSDTYSPVNSTISKDKTIGEFAHQAELLAHFGQKIKPCMFASLQREEDVQLALTEEVDEETRQHREGVQVRAAQRFHLGKTTAKMGVTNKTNTERTNLGPARLYLGNLPQNSA
jgi:hypothetical protein